LRKTAVFQRFLKLKTVKTHGTVHWSSNSAPEEVLKKGSFFTIATDGFVANINNYNHEIFFDHVESSSIHGRSCYLGMDNQNNHYFAKGTGWNHVFGWQPSFGSLGILPLWAGTRERDISLALGKTSIKVVSPISILKHNKIPKFGSTNIEYSFIDAKSVLDLDGSPANPCVYIYSSKSRWRLADIFFFNEQERKAILFNDITPLDWFVQLIKSITLSTATLHNLGGYDYFLSNHNVFIDGTRLDFEYVVLGSHPHPNKILNENIDMWRQKEIYGLKTLAWELAELMRVDIAVKDIDDILKTEYEMASDLIYPF
jgi:hypothetical protein